MKPTIVVFSSDERQIEELKTRGQQSEFMDFVVGAGPLATAKAHLDAIWVSPMLAVERLGVAPTFPYYEATVLPMPPHEVSRGMPKYAVVGVSVPPDHPQDPELNLPIKIDAFLKAVGEFNQNSVEKINRIGFLPEDLLLDRLNLRQVIAAIEQGIRRRG